MYVSHHFFVSKFLKEISIIVTFIFCLNFPVSKCPKFALICYQFTASLLLESFVLLEIMEQLTKSINTWITWIIDLLKRDLVRVRKSC